MEVIEVLHMNGGIGESSYANNSLLQQNVLSTTMTIKKKAMADLYRNISQTPTTFCIADLGCSSGPNTFFVVFELIKTLDKIRAELGRESPEYQIYLNDLPGNDFNTIFRSLSGFHQNLRKQFGMEFGPCFFTGVPGSFYGRLFASSSVHFVHSSYSLHWLSKIPEEVRYNNKGNIYMSNTSPPSVIKAYYEQFQKDFSLFLRCRCEELVEGGRMVLTMIGRKSDDPTSKEGCYIWELLGVALNNMVSEGIIEEEKLNSFNIPKYTPSPFEVKYEVEKQGSFAIDYLEVCQVNWNAYADKVCPSDEFKDGGYNVAKCMRAVAEPLLLSHFGKEQTIIDEIFNRYRVILTDRMSKERTEFYNVTVSMTKTTRF